MPTNPSFNPLKICRKCHYNLRGIAVGVPCPECGELNLPPGVIGVEDDLVVVRRGAVFPKRCIRTNQPLERGSIVEALVWHDPLKRGSVQKRCVIRFYFSDHKSPFDKWFGVFRGALFVGGLATVFWSGQFSGGGQLLNGIGILMIFLSIAVGWRPYHLSIVRNEDEVFWIKGCSSEFLRSLREEIDPPRESLPESQTTPPEDGT